ncbi:MAG: cell division protein ZapA [Crocinitomicaceae bacterium]|nr:cell division protein ZapA [Crocinitomicaceae bacterium]
MAKLSLKVVVAGRTYPLSVNEDEQEKVMKAADDINKAIKLLQDNYAVKDVQDLLAMTALQLASKSESKKSTDSISNDHAEIEKKLESLSDELDELK